MEIEVGEYVRTIDGFVGIFDRYSKRPDTSIYKSPFNCFIKLQNRKTPLQCHRDYIVKHSKIISEIVEVGDYVNGHRVEQVSIETNEVLLDHNGFGWRTLKYGDKIVTHEQFESIEYKVESEEK